MHCLLCFGDALFMFSNNWYGKLPIQRDHRLYVTSEPPSESEKIPPGPDSGESTNATTMPHSLSNWFFKITNKNLELNKYHVFLRKGVQSCTAHNIILSLFSRLLTRNELILIKISSVYVFTLIKYAFWSDDNGPCFCVGLIVFFFVDHPQGSGSEKCAYHGRPRVQGSGFWIRKRRRRDARVREEKWRSPTD